MVEVQKNKGSIWFFEDRRMLGGFDFQYCIFYGSRGTSVSNKPKFFAGEPKNEMDTATLIWRSACNNAYDAYKMGVSNPLTDKCVSFIERCAAVGILAKCSCPSDFFQKIFPKIKLDKNFVETWNKDMGEGAELNETNYLLFSRLQETKELRASYPPAIASILVEIKTHFPDFTKQNLDALVCVIQKHHLYFVPNSIEKIISWAKMKIEMNEPLNCKESFFLDYNTTEKRHYAYVNRRVSEEICANNDLPYLYYRDDDWIVAPLLSAEDFHREAEQQHNCVERIYMEQVQKGRTHVISLRLACRPDRSYITCEVKNGKIEQWLTANNTKPPKSCDKIKHKLALQFMKGWTEIGR